MNRIIVTRDCNPNRSDAGEAYMNCGRCLMELPYGKSPKEWARQQVAFTKDGSIQVRCTRHDLNIATLSFELAEGTA